MKLSFLSAIAAAANTAAAATSTPAGWTDDYDAALVRAGAENKLVLADFSGSDWCGWCKKLDREVFAEESFVSSATNSYVLLMVDSPKDKSLLSEKAKTQNPGLVKKYKVRGYPTVMLIDAKGEPVATTGYRQGGPAKYLEHLAEISKQASDPEYKTVVKPLEEKLEKAMDDFYKAMERDIASLYEKHLPELEKVLDDAKAVKVSGKNKPAADEAVEEFERNVKTVRRMVEKAKSSGKEGK